MFDLVWLLSLDTFKGADSNPIVALPLWACDSSRSIGFDPSGIQAALHYIGKSTMKRTSEQTEELVELTRRCNFRSPPEDLIPSRGPDEDPRAWDSLWDYSTNIAPTPTTLVWCSPQQLRSLAVVFKKARFDLTTSF
jgi:hypothetical protein